MTDISIKWCRRARQEDHGQGAGSLAGSRVRADQALRGRGSRCRELDPNDLTIPQIARMFGVKAKQVRAIMQLTPEQRAALTTSAGSKRRPLQQRSGRRHRRQGRCQPAVGGDRSRHVAEVERLNERHPPRRVNQSAGPRKGLGVFFDPSNLKIRGNNMDTISNITPTASTTPVSPLEQMRAKIHDAEKEFAKALRAEFKAMYDRASELYDEISEVRSDGDLLKPLNKALKGLYEVVQTLSDGIDEDA